MDTDLNDIEKIQVVLASSSRQLNKEDTSANSEFPPRCESADGFSVASSYQQHLTPQAEFSIFDENSAESNTDYLVVVEDLEVSANSAKVLNHTYRNMLLDLRDQLHTLQHVNRGRQEELKREIEILTEQEANKKSDKQRRKRFSLSFFGIPYFKDISYHAPPANEDTNQIQSITTGLGLQNVSLFHFNKPFKKTDVNKIKSGMKREAVGFVSQRLVVERDALERSLAEDEMSEEERKIVQHKIEELNRRILHISNLPHNDLFNVDPNKIEWEFISNSKFGRFRTADQLRLLWTNSQRPGINNQTWSFVENKQLKELVKRSGDQVDWIEVANTLNNNRTMFDCFCHYQSLKIKKKAWTDEEKDRIMKIVQRCIDKTTGEISWHEVRQHFPGRTKNQIYAHYKYSLSIKHVDQSPFTEAEDSFIREGINMGYNCADIALLIGKRNTRQVSCRYRLLSNRKKGIPPPWTEKENSMMLKIKNESDLKRHKTNRLFPGRTFYQVFARYHFLRVQSTTPEKYAEELRAKALEARKKKPKYAEKYSKKVINLIRNMGIQPIIKTRDVVNVGEKRKSVSMFNGRTGKRKKLYAHLSSRTVKQRGKILKEILRPLMNLNPKRPRKLAFVGDGREYGLISACIYRLLNCNFTLAPKGELSEDELFDLGIKDIHHLTFTNLLQITDGLAPPVVEFDKIICLPPSLTSLAGFRGILLHRKYLETSASLPYEPPEAPAPTLVAIEGPPEEPVAGPSRQHQPIESVAIEDGPDTTSAPPLEKTTNVSLQESSVESMDCDEPQPSSSEKNVDEVQNVAISSEDDAEQAKDTNLEADESQNEEDSEEEEPVFGNAEADSLLLSRMISVFFWPGIMSTMHVPKALKQTVQRQTEEAEETAEDTPPPRKKSRQVIAKEKRERMRVEMKKRMLKKYPDRAQFTEAAATIAQATEGESSSAPVTPEPKSKPQPKKRAPRNATPGPPVRASDRVTRNSRSRSNTPQEVEEIE